MKVVQWYSGIEDVHDVDGTPEEVSFWITEKPSGSILDDEVLDFFFELEQDDIEDIFKHTVGLEHLANWQALIDEAKQ